MQKNPNPRLTRRPQLFTVPPYAIACCFSVLVAWLSDRHRKRGLYIALSTLLTITGYAVLISVKSPNLRYMAVFFAASGAFPLGPAFLSWGLNSERLPAHPPAHPILTIPRRSWPVCARGFERVYCIRRNHRRHPRNVRAVHATSRTKTT